MKSDKEIVGTLLGFDDFVNILPTVSMGGCMLVSFPDPHDTERGTEHMEQWTEVEVYVLMEKLDVWLHLWCAVHYYPDPSSLFGHAVCSTILNEVIEGCSHRSGWLAFNLTTFL